MTLSLENRNNNSQSSTIKTVSFPIISRQEYLPPLLPAEPSLATRQPADEVAAVAGRTLEEPGSRDKQKGGAAVLRGEDQRRRAWGRTTLGRRLRLRRLELAGSIAPLLGIGGLQFPNVSVNFWGIIDCMEFFVNFLAFPTTNSINRY